VRAPSDVLAFSLLNLCNSANAAGVRSANGAVRTLVIVVLSELRELLPGIFQRRKPLHVQTLVPQSAIETLDECVLHRPAWPDETQLDPVLDYLHLQGATAELAAVVHCNARRQTAPLRSCLLQGMHDFHSGHGSIGFQPYTFSRELVHRRQNAERTASLSLTKSMLQHTFAPTAIGTARR